MVAPVSVCMIVRDEHQQLDRCLRSIRPHVAEIVVVDTGSSDDSVEIAKRHADVVETWTGCNDPQGRMLRFDLARSRSFDLAKQPWVMWVDGDDEVTGAEHLSDLCRQYDADRGGAPALVTMPYEYSHDDRGKLNMLLERERLFTPRAEFEWKGWVHEVFCPKSAYHRKHTNAVKMIHHRGNKKSEPGRNLRILEAQRTAEGDSDARLLYYLGQEYGYAGKVDEAIEVLTKHVQRSGWDDERYMACQLIARHYIDRSEHEKALDWAMKATVIHESWAEAYFTAAKACYFLASKKGPDSFRWWQRCVHFARTGLSKPPTSTPLFINPLERDLEIHRYLNMALSLIGETPGALESVKKALLVRPDDEQLLKNKEIYERYLATEDFKRSIGKLKDAGVIDEKIRSFLEDPTTLKDRIASPRKWTPLESGRQKQIFDIVFYVGPSLEAWNPETARKGGIGGSETAVIEMSRRLAVMGHRVRVYGDCARDGRSIEGTFDGVTYLHHEKARGESCDVLVASRRPEAVDVLGMRFDRAWLWVHDVHCGSALTLERAEKFEKILVLSDWHRAFMIQTYPFLRNVEDRIEKTRNGIDLTRFDAESGSSIPRNPHRAIYSSSPDRGLQCALDIWPEVRKRVPDAELHIYYGFENWEKCASGEAWATIANLKKAIEERKNDGVVFHGRTPQDVLAKEMLGSGVWCYPTWFHETSCITAMESQAAGLRMVTSPLAALNETVGSRGTLVPGIFGSEGYKIRFTDALVEAMTEFGNEDRKKLQTYARDHFGWDGLAKDWNAMLGSSFDQTSESPKPSANVAEEHHPVVQSGGMTVHAVLSDFASGGTFDPSDPDGSSGGGCRPSFMGFMRELPKYGHKVRAFSTFTQARTIGDVEYLPLSELDKHGQPNVMWAFYDVRVLSGRSGMFRIASHHTYHFLNAPFFYIDVNTVPSEAALATLKPFWAPWSKWAVLPNAVGPGMPAWKPVPGRVVYHTSADRGLHHLLNAWPAIKSRVPHATLHVIGRVEQWVQQSPSFGLENSEWGLRIRACRDGLARARAAGDVTIRSDLPRAELLRELSEANVFAFPCSVVAPSETFSMSVMECCKIGVPVVLSPADALKSIYKNHVLMTPAPVENHLLEFADGVVRVLSDDKVAQHYSRLGQALAEPYTFERAGKVLDSIIRGKI